MEEDISKELTPGKGKNLQEYNNEAERGRLYVRLGETTRLTHKLTSVFFIVQRANKTKGEGGEKETGTPKRWVERAHLRALPAVDQLRSFEKRGSENIHPGCQDSLQEVQVAHREGDAVEAMEGVAIGKKHRAIARTKTVSQNVLLLYEYCHN